MNEYTKEHAYVSGCIDSEALQFMTPTIVTKRNLMLILLSCHLLVIFALLALTTARRVVLAMIVNLGFAISLLTGLLIYTRFNVEYGKYFLTMMSFIIVASITLMLVEAFALYTPSDERAFVFYVNTPIIIDIGFDVAFIVIHVKHFRQIEKLLVNQKCLPF